MTKKTEKNLKADASTQLQLLSWEKKRVWNGLGEKYFGVYLPLLYSLLFW